jgi:hypothetical protein
MIDSIFINEGLFAELWWSLCTLKFSKLHAKDELSGRVWHVPLQTSVCLQGHAVSYISASEYRPS